MPFCIRIYALYIILWKISPEQNVIFFRWVSSEDSGPVSHQSQVLYYLAIQSKRDTTFSVMIYFKLAWKQGLSSGVSLRSFFVWFVWNYGIMGLTLTVGSGEEILRSDSLSFFSISLTCSLLVSTAPFTACLENMSARISLAINAHWSTILKIHLLPTFST